MWLSAIRVCSHCRGSSSYCHHPVCCHFHWPTHQISLQDRRSRRAGRSAALIAQVTFFPTRFLIITVYLQIFTCTYCVSLCKYDSHNIHLSILNPFYLTEIQKNILDVFFIVTICSTILCYFSRIETFTTRCYVLRCRWPTEWFRYQMASWRLKQMELQQ